MKPEDAFEQRLKRVPLKPLPEELRQEILKQAAQAESLSSREKSSLTWREVLMGMLWPHPRAWAALGVAWVVIVMANLQLREAPGAGLARTNEPAPPQIEQARQQKAQLYAELGLTSLPDADRPKKSIPRPRTERTSQFGTV